MENETRGFPADNSPTGGIVNEVINITQSGSMKQKAPEITKHNAFMALASEEFGMEGAIELENLPFDKQKEHVSDGLVDLPSHIQHKDDHHEVEPDCCSEHVDMHIQDGLGHESDCSEETNAKQVVAVETQLSIHDQPEVSIGEKKRRGRPPKAKQAALRQSERLKGVVVEEENKVKSPDVQKTILELNRRAEAVRITGLHVSSFVVSENLSTALTNMDFVAGFREVELKGAVASEKASSSP